MVVDYLVDFDYLARELEKNSTDSSFFLGLKMLCDAVEFDNARFMADEQLQCLEPIKRISAKFDETSNEGRKKKRIAARLCQQSSVNHWYRRVADFSGLGCGMALSPAPLFILSNKGYPGEHWKIGNRAPVSIEDYYAGWDYEKRRIRLAKRQTYGSGFSNDNEFNDAVKRFACSDVEFKIFDRYAIGLGESEKLCEACRNILYWIKMLSNDFKTRCCFEIWANCREEILCNKEKLLGDLNCQLSKLREALFYDLGYLNQTVTFHLIPGDGRTLSAPHFHDRFICSRTRVLSIGKGVDALKDDGLPNCINLQYCGRYHSDVLMERLNRMKYDALKIQI